MLSRLFSTKPRSFCMLSGLISDRLSRSKRTTCWFRATTLVLMLVGLSSSVMIPSDVRCSFFISLRIFRPGLSLPITPQRTGVAPRVAIFRITLAAPPSILVSLLTSTTGTGASGEIRVTLPQKYSSRMISPITRTLASTNLSIYPFRR